MDTLLKKARVIAVVTLHNLKDAIPLARALQAGGISTIEITLRTEIALDAIIAIHQAYPELTIGAGTVLTPHQLRSVQEQGASFAVSPGFLPSLGEAAQNLKMPFLPGVCTPSEIMAALSLGFHCLKLFPAEWAGGAAMLRQYHTVFPDIRFCPTGGVTESKLSEYLQLPNVLAVGGTWMTPTSLIAHQDFDAIHALAERAVQTAAKYPI